MNAGIIAPVEIPEDDYASMLAALEARLPREDIAAALGTEERVLDDIASGYAPDTDVAERLRSLATAKADRSRLRGRGMLIVVFVASDLIFFAIVAALVLFR
jgi:hypothetical protein